MVMKFWFVLKKSARQEMAVGINLVIAVVLWVCIVWSIIMMVLSRRLGAPFPHDWEFGVMLQAMAQQHRGQNPYFISHLVMGGCSATDFGNTKCVLPGARFNVHVNGFPPAPSVHEVGLSPFQVPRSCQILRQPHMCVCQQLLCAGEVLQG